jgi:ferric-dicitrate binding protein FerR (iron transport regulator)
MPFQVTVNGVHFETTGACFNIQAHETDASKKVTVVSGTVRVTAGPYITYVKANQAALVEKNKPIAILKADTARAIAWKNRLFHFEKESMATVLRELCRWYDVTLSGNFNRKLLLSYKGSRDEKIPVVLKEIQRENPGFHYRLEGKKLIIE